MNQRSTLLQKLDGFSLAALIVAMLAQINVKSLGRDTLAEGLGYASKTFSIAVCDVVFAAVVAWFVMRTIQTKSWKKLWWPPLPCWALMFAVVLSLVHADNMHEMVAVEVAKHFGPRAFLTKETKEAIKVLIQFSGYFIFAPWVLVNLIHDRRGDELISRRDLAFKSLFGAVALAILVAFVQAFHFEGKPREKVPEGIDSSLVRQAAVPRGLLSSGNVFSAVLAILLPMLWAWWAGYCSPRKLDRALEICLPIMTLAAVFSMASVPAIGILLLGIAVAMGLLLRSRPKVGLATILVAVTVTVGLFATLPVVREGRTDFLHVNSDIQKVKKQYIEWEVATNWNSPRERAFATGVGPGNYQNMIGTMYQYGSLPNHEKVPSDSNNMFLVQGMSLGILGLGALLWMVGHFMGIARQAMRRNPGDWLPAGILASLVAWLLVNNFHALIVRGAGLIPALLFALAVIAAEGERNPAAGTLSED